MNYFGIYANSGEVETALSAGTLNKPYVAIVSGVLDYDSVIPVPPAETRLKITYNFETTDETLVLSNMWTLFHDAPGKAEFPDGTEFNYDPDGEYESSDIKYTPSTIGIASIYYTFTGDTIGDEEDGDTLLYSYESMEGAPVISFEIPDQVNTIGKFAFDNASYTAITIPNHALTIGYGAFSWTNGDEGGLVSINNGENTIPSGSVLCGATFFGQPFEKITIGQGVTFGLDGDDGDFDGCNSLTSITFLDTTPPSINDRAVDWFGRDGVPVVINVPVGSENAYVDSFNQDCSSKEFRYVSPGIIEVDEP